MPINVPAFQDEKTFKELGVRYPSLEPVVGYVPADQSSIAPGGGLVPLHREVISVRTPLMANQQESCV